ncbi:MAG: DNA-methyltransferase [Thermoplasmataceae archaeon]
MNISIRNGNVLDELKKIPDNSVDCIVTSSPYYGLRNYGASDVVWDGNSDCGHEWGYIFPKSHKTGGNNVGKAKSTWIRSSRNAQEGGNSGTFCKKWKCNAWKGELGQEPSYKLYLQHLLQITKELKRILKPTGTMFWNIGDSYAGSGGWEGKNEESVKYISNVHLGKGAYPDKPPNRDNDIPAKSQMMIPERFSIALTDEQKWIRRNFLVWYKRSGMPESMDDRFSRKWEPIFFFTKNKRYYFNLDSIRKPLSLSTSKELEKSYNGIGKKDYEGNGIQNPSEVKRRIVDNMRQKYESTSAYKNLDGADQINENGANPGDVFNNESIYSFLSDPSILSAFMDYLQEERPELLIDQVLDIPTMPHSFSHFAVFPTTLVEPLIKAGCPKEVCSKCGKPKMPFREKTGRTYDSRNGEYTDEGKYISRKVAETNNVSESSVFRTDLIQETKTVMKPSCSCNVNFIPGTVLDPFAGSGTVGVVAKKLGVSAILIEVVPEYVEIIKKRLETDEIESEFQEVSTMEDYEVDE